MCKMTHLHNHTEYSMLDGYSSISSYVERAIRNKQDSLAITDHGNMHGVIEFYDKLKSANIHPVLGCELYANPFGTAIGEKIRSPNHLLALARTQKGYENLLFLNKVAYSEGFYYKPRIDHFLLSEHSDGLVVTSGCMAAAIPQAIDRGDFIQAENIIKWYIDVFGSNFYIELQRHPGIKELDEINKHLVSYAKKYGVQMILTNDSHYANPSDAPIHDILLCVQTRQNIYTKDRFKFTDNEYYLKSDDEMRELFRGFLDDDEIDKALVNSYEIAHSCEVNPAENRKPRIPIITIETGQSPDEYLKELTYRNISNVYPDWQTNDVVKNRVEEELLVIEQTGFANYFLLILDIVEFAKKNNILYNTRGSAAGSIINYIIGVSLVDPLENKLMFSRFLNPYRVSIPDCDLDFPDNRRTDVFNYIIDRWGDEYVAQVVTFGHMKARASVRDVGRALDIPLSKVDVIAKSIKNTPGKPIDLKNSVDPTSEYFSEDFYNLTREDPPTIEIMKYAGALENVVRHSGIHAAAILIGNDKLEKQIPLMTSKQSRTRYTSQLDYTTAEGIGMLKVDLLGSATLSIIKETIDLINIRHGKNYTIDNIPYMDKSSFEILSEGNTIGIFQVENSGLTRYLVQMMPTTFGQVSDMISLYRPGPISYIPNYIARLHGIENLSSKHHLLEEITSDTQGIMIYQEQVNQVLMKLGGYNAGDADKVRKAISKKSVVDIEKNRYIFVDGCRNNDIPESTAESIYDDINEFALYGFNRAHAASYSRITLITAWLKANYTIEFITSCLNIEGNDNTKRTKYIHDAKRNNIGILPPQIGGKSHFTISGKNIVFGISSIDEIGEKAAKLISSAAEDTIFSIGLKRNQLVNMIKAGMFDYLGDRGKTLANVDTIDEYAKRFGKWAKINQKLMFYPDVVLEDGNTSLYEIAIMESDVLGAWITYHPLQIIATKIKQAVSRLSEIGENGFAIGVITKLEEIKTNKGYKMFKFRLVDEWGSIEVIAGTKFAKQHNLRDGDIIHCHISANGDEMLTYFINEMRILHGNTD